MENIDKNISPKDEPEDLSRAITKEYLNKLNLKKEDNKVSPPSPIAKSSYQQLEQKKLQENETKIKKTIKKLDKCNCACYNSVVICNQFVTFLTVIVTD